MNELMKAIETIQYRSNRFPTEAFEVIVNNREQSIPLLRQAMETAMNKQYELEDDYELHFYAMFLLGQFQDRAFFPRMIDFVSLPSEVMDYLVGDAITSGMSDIVYNMFNGDIELLKNTVMNPNVDEYVRAGLLDVMGQLYLDGILRIEEWKSFLRMAVYSGEIYSYFYEALGMVICRCHFVDMLPEIRFMLEQSLMSEELMGTYDACVDDMFTYWEHEKYFCKSPMQAADMLKGWAMYADKEPEMIEEKIERKLEQVIRSSMKPESVRKIGRNEPCPCGSGRKYKHCCLNKPASPLDAIESPQERVKWLMSYPQIGGDKVEGRIYLEDYFDAESIEVDKILYLGLNKRPGLIWLKDEAREEKRCKQYLKVAFQRFMEKVEKEGITTFEEYDEKCGIHYFCEEWTGKLFDLLKKSGEDDLCKEVQLFRQKMLECMQ